jgi:hypothetical protein
MLEELVQKSRRLSSESHLLLSKHESSKSRIILIEDTYRKLSALSLTQHQLFTESLRCLEGGFFKAAHVLAWAGFMDFIEEKIAADGFKALRNCRPKWLFKGLEDMREQFPEFQLIEAARDIGILGKGEAKSLLGLLSKRNECAHPSDYEPTANESLGFVSELLLRVGRVQKRFP